MHLISRFRLQRKAPPVKFAGVVAPSRKVRLSVKGSRVTVKDWDNWRGCLGGSVGLVPLFFFLVFKCLFIFERQSESGSGVGREREREGDTESEAGSRLSSQHGTRSV